MKKIEINEEDLKINLQEIRAFLQDKHSSESIPKIIGVVKGNGIGLGLQEYAKFLTANNVDMLAVANFEEAIKIRENNKEIDLLMLTPVVNKEELETLIQENVILTIGSLEDLILIEEFVKDQDDIIEINVHLKIDTGLGRYGVIFSNIEEVLEIYKNCKKVKIAGIYTHFSKPMDKKWTFLQFNRFLNVIENIKKEKFYPGISHCCASTAFLKYPEMHLDAIRLGSVVQGRTLIYQEKFKKVGILKTKIIAIKQLPKGYFISYNKAYKTKKDTKVAIIPVGYMDGFNKGKLRDDFSFKNNILAVGIEIKKIFKDNSLKVTIHNQRYRVIGKIGMYHSIIDITGNEDIKVGDEAILDVAPLQTNEEIRREYV